MDRQLVLIFDFGGQTAKLIARRVREQHVYCEIVPYDKSFEEIKKMAPSALIFSGGPKSIYDENAPKIDRRIYSLDVPILGICYGMQLLTLDFGGKVERSEKREYGLAKLISIFESPLLLNIDPLSNIWMSHGDSIVNIPDNFKIIAKTENTPVAAFVNEEKQFYGVQFHPEVEHTELGREIISNFLFNVAKLKADWKLDSFIEEQVEKIKEMVGNKKVVCGLSGGVDSSVAATIVHKAIGDQLTCIFVNHGLLRKDEAAQVIDTFGKKMGMKLIYADESYRFISKLKGISDPESKRKIIGEEFIRVFEEKAKEIGDAKFLVQGTIYPDVIESGTNTAALIKSHHNVGGLPEDIDFDLIEPLRELFKDEVRKVGSELGLPDDIVKRQPFPGPGLAIRIMGDITFEKVALLQEADAIFRQEIRDAGLYDEIWQAFAVLPGVRSVGVMGDERTYSNLIALRAVSSTDAMTADWSRIPYEVLAKVSNRIVNEVEGVNRVVYDITSKPPATIEWE
ncbi:MAG: glutamine-hydrolyzing GMP synthase [Clostridia bacterium]